MSREVMQMALEALEESEQHYGSDAALRDAIQALRAALKGPYCDDCGGTDPECPLKQEPVEFVCSTGLCHYRRPLTDEEIVSIELRLRKYVDGNRYDLSLNEFARAIERAHGIKQEEA